MILNEYSKTREREREKQSENAHVSMPNDETGTNKSKNVQSKNRRYTPFGITCEHAYELNEVYTGQYIHFMLPRDIIDSIILLF